MSISGRDFDLGDSSNYYTPGEPAASNPPEILDTSPIREALLRSDFTRFDFIQIGSNGCIKEIDPSAVSLSQGGDHIIIIDHQQKQIIMDEETYEKFGLLIEKMIAEENPGWAQAEFEGGYFSDILLNASEDQLEKNRASLRRSIHKEIQELLEAAREAHIKGDIKASTIYHQKKIAEFDAHKNDTELSKQTARAYALSEMLKSYKFIKADLGDIYGC